VPQFPRESSSCARACARAYTRSNASSTSHRKKRLGFLDGLRGLLVGYICVGHFAGCVISSPALLAALCQVNVAVGGLFVISGYAAMYSASSFDGNHPKVDLAKVEPCIGYTARRIAAFYPLHLIALVLFGPLLAMGELSYNSVSETAFRAVISVLLLQSWFPMRAEVFNSPTWFLSALGFALLVLPYALIQLSRLSRKGLRICIATCAALSALCKFSYSVEVPGSFQLFDALTSGKLHPNLMAWNATRFSPFGAMLEVITGAAAARLPLLDRVQRRSHTDSDGGDGSSASSVSRTESALVPMILVGVLVVLRAYFSPQYGVNDGIARSLVFLPAFLSLLVRLHRLTDNDLENSPTVSLTAAPALRWLGTISFPLFIVHAPLGQVLYKRAIASKLWGSALTNRPLVFVGWIVACLVLAQAAHRYIIRSKRVQAASESAAQSITRLLTSQPEEIEKEDNDRLPREDSIDFTNYPSKSDSAKGSDDHTSASMSVQQS